MSPVNGFRARFNANITIIIHDIRIAVVQSQYQNPNKPTRIICIDEMLKRNIAI